ncbi:MAG TPA: ABC transporter permease [Patescibacteria group bacterium]|nr:ABC transporter permease [Patescibacteria group bacterium]
MSVFSNAVKLGFERGWIDFKRFMASPGDIIPVLLIAAISLGFLWYQRDSHVGGISLALVTLPSIMGMIVAFSGFSNISGLLTYEQEDGTLLRAKTIPQGIQGYFISRLVFVALTTAIMLLSILPALFFVDGVSINFIQGIELIGILVLGFVATVTWGAIVGSLIRSAKDASALMFPTLLIVGISGIFYPITALWGWVQVIAQIFPVYWLGLGARSIILPHEAVASEIAKSWRTPEMLVVLAVWAVAGLFIAPRVLSRMTRRATGSRMTEDSERAKQYQPHP